MSHHTPTPDTPPAAFIEAPLSWQCIEFFSDLHLQASTPRTVQALMAYLRTTPAQAIFILGDLFEAWVGDDARHDALAQAIVMALHAASRTRWIGLMVGNRDFLLGSDFARDAGIQLLADPSVLQFAGQRILLSHGDLLCTGDLSYQAFRQQVRAPAWQTEFLSRALPERRAIAQGLRDASMARHAAAAPENISDVDPATVDAWMLAHQVSLMIHGHTHRPAAHPLNSGRMRLVLSDWDLDGAQPRGDVLRLTPQGAERLALTA